MLDTASFIAELQESEIGRAMRDERVQRQRAARQVLVTALRAVGDRLRAARETAQKQLEVLDRKHRKAAEVAETAAYELLAQRQAHQHAIGALEAEQRTVERQLVAGADPAIDEARRALEARWEVARGQTIAYAEPVADQYYVSGAPVMQGFSNAAAAARICHGVVQARQRLEALKRENPDDLQAAIAAIIDAVPFAEMARVETVG